MSELIFNNISKTYATGGSAVLAVKDLSLQVNDGEIVGLLGSSGCGKTTTLRSVAGFVDLTAGSITLAGEEIHQLPPARRQVTMAFEGYALYPPLRVRENIGFALLRNKVPREEADKAVQEIAAILEIEDVLDSFPAAISAGQQQRTSLARALIRRAPVTLLDEPMSQLDPRLRTLVRARVKDYLARNRMTTIFVTHDQNEAITLADRIAVMEEGRLEQYDTALNLRDYPANLFVAEFIGEPPMNIITAELGSVNGNASLRLLHNDAAVGELQAPAEVAKLAAQSKVALGIRPHRLLLSSSGGLQATIVSSQWLGDQAHLLVDIQGLRLVAVMMERRSNWRPGTQVGVELPEDAMRFFDHESGVSLQPKPNNPQK